MACLALLPIFNVCIGQTVVTPMNGNITNTNHGVIYALASEPNRFSLYQHIYKQPLINQSGTITHIQFRNQMQGSFTNVILFLGETTKNSFADGNDWVNTGLTQVYSGPLNIVNGWYEIALSTPFTYTNTNNLILAVHQNGGVTPNANSARHITGTHDANVTIRNYGTSSYGTYPNWNPGFGSRFNELPSIKLTFASACNASVVSTAPAERCGPGSVSLNASVSAGSVARWFDQPSGGNLLATGSPFNTPVINQTTPFWVEAFDASGNCSSSRTSVLATVNDIPQQPVTACYETAVLNTATCTWEITGSIPQEPITACYETSTFNLVTCVWEVTGTHPAQPEAECYEAATFNTTACEWEVNTLWTNEVVLSGNTLTAVQAGFDYQWIDCNTNLPVSGAINQTFTPAVSGSYAVQLTETASGCERVSACTDIQLLSLDNYDAEAWQLYPNPASGVLYIKGAESGAEFCILSLSGQEVYKQMIYSAEVQIPLKELRPSLYFVKISGPSGQHIRKLLVR